MFVETTVVEHSMLSYHNHGPQSLSELKVILKTSPDKLALIKYTKWICT